MSRSNGLSFYKKKKKINYTIIKEVLSGLFWVLVAIFLAAVLVYFLGMSTNVVGISMEPTLKNGQKILIDRFTYTFSEPKEGDVVVFLPNGNKNTHYYVKRVIACPGDTVVIRSGVCYVNGVESTKVKGRISDAGIAHTAIVLEKGEYFCIGDDSANSEDSRSANIGPVEEEDIIGKVWFRLTKEDSKMGFVR